MQKVQQINIIHKNQKRRMYFLYFVLYQKNLKILISVKLYPFFQQDLIFQEIHIKMEKLEYQNDKQQFIFPNKLSSRKYAVDEENSTTMANAALPIQTIQKTEVSQSSLFGTYSSVFTVKDGEIFLDKLNFGKYAIRNGSSMSMKSVPSSNNTKNKKEISQSQLLFGTSAKGFTMKEGEALITTNAFVRQKKQQFIKVFVQKLKRNIVRTIDQKQSDNIAFNMTNFEQTQNISEQQQALFQNNIINNGLFIIKSLLILFLFLLTTIYVSFEDANELYGQVIGLKGGIILLTLLEMIKRSINIGKEKNQKRLKLLKKQLERKKRILAMLFTITVSIALNKQIAVQIVLVLMYFLQLINLLEKMKIIENYVFHDSGFERYWDLCKILLVNFFIAHCLSIVLNSMVHLEVQGDSWYNLKSLIDKPWFEKYIWGYYWGTTIMLSVGFGDISANNYLEALCLVFIETVSCIILAYNISQVSKIIQNMRELDNEKNHKLKVFHTIAKKYQIPEQLSNSVKNHIKQSIKMKKDFNITQEQNIIKQLPQKLQSQLKKQINKSIFNGVYFLGDLTSKCQQKLSEKIYKIVAHPDQLILRKGQPWKVLILRTGIVGLAYRRDKSVLNGMIIDTTKITSQKSKKLISTSFIWGGHAQGDLKSLTVSVLATIQKQMLEEVLKQHNLSMFEYYCCERDRFQNRMLNRAQKCQVCKHSNHSKVYCPAMHYIPLQQILIRKQLKSLGKQGLRVDKQNRASEFFRKKNISGIYIPLKNCQGMMLNQPVIESIQNAKNNASFKRSFNASNQIKCRNSIFGNMIYQLRKSNNNMDMISNNAELNRKVEKFQSSLDQILNIMKNNQDQVQLETDKPCNYKSYFIRYNPQNLSNIYAGAMQQKVSRLLSQSKKICNKNGKASCKTLI